MVNTPKTLEVAWPLHLAFLDGLRAVAAWLVVFHHAWLIRFPGFPDNVGPWWTGWLRWGRLPVAVFIVLSGFSLALGPARNGDRLVGGAGRFLRRRAWRILPPYWTAVLLSAAMIVVYTGARTGAQIDVRSIAVHGLLLQNVVESHSPNGALWSIAVEWQIYFAFPLLLWLLRSTSARTMTGLTTAAAVAAYAAGTSGVGAFDKLLQLSPQFLALFAFGVLAGRSVLRATPDLLLSRRAARAVGAGTAATVVILTVVPSAKVVHHFFWLDLLVGAITAAALFALSGSGLGRLRRVLETPALGFTGRFSYSTYLVHAPLLLAIDLALGDRLPLPSSGRFLVYLAVAVPITCVVTYRFHVAFERPFMQHRSLADLRRVRLSAPRPLPVVPRR